MRPSARNATEPLTFSDSVCMSLAFNRDILRGSAIKVCDEMVGFPPTLVMVIPVPAVRFGVRSQVRVVMSASAIVAVPVTDKSASMEILEALTCEAFAWSHVKVEMFAFVICAVPLNIEKVGSANVIKSGRSSTPLSDRLELNSIVVATCGAE